MNIGIVTRRDGYNIGTSLQAYAIQQVISSLKCQCLVVNYCEYSWKARIRYFTLNVLGVITSFFPKSNFRIGYKQRMRFVAFDNRLKKTKKRYHYTINKAINQDFDCFVCGSDQIWNPQQLTNAFLLDFVYDSKKKIAYAPSIGQNSKPGDFSESSIRLISRFNALSCREYEGAQCLELMTKHKCQLVLDPTLLISRDTWIQNETRMEVPQRYILCYFLGHNNYPVGFITKLAKECGLKIINVCMFYYGKINVGINKYVSPDEFLYLVNHANIVCTNSYHGTLFSLIYNKPFYVFHRNYSVPNYNESSRFESLFSLLKLEVPIMSIDAQNIPAINLDYIRINNELLTQRIKSINFLEEAIYGNS